MSEDLGVLYNGCHLYREPNGVGGHKYFSDEIGGGVTVWNTGLVGEGTLLAAICCEHNRKYQEHIRKVKTNWEPTQEMLMEQCAATGGSFIPKAITDTSVQEEHDIDAPDWLKILAIECYLAYEGRDQTHNVKKKTPEQFDECDYGWKRDWLRVARIFCDVV